MRKTAYITALALLFIYAAITPAARGAEIVERQTSTHRLSTRAQSEGPAGVVFDLVFWASYVKQSASDIASPLSLAAEISKSSHRPELISLSLAAKQGKHTLPIPGAGEGIRQFQAACRVYESIRREPDPLAAVAKLDQCESELSALKATLAAAWMQKEIASIYLFRLSRNQEAEEHYESVLSVFARFGLSASQADLYCDLAYSYDNQRMPQAAERHYAEAGNLYSEAGNPAKAADCLLDSAQCLLLCRELTNASRRAEDAVKIAERSYIRGGDPAILVNVLIRAGELLSQMGNEDRQAQLLRKASTRASEAGDPHLQYRALDALAGILPELEAQKTRKLAKTILTEYAKALGARVLKLGKLATPSDDYIRCLTELAWACEQEGKYLEAAKAYQQVAQLQQKSARPDEQLAALVSRRRCVLQIQNGKLGEPEDQIAVTAEKLGLWEKACSERLSLAEAHVLEPMAARSHYERALEASRKSGNPAFLFNALFRYSQFLAKQPDKADLPKLLAEAIQITQSFPCEFSDLNRLYLLSVQSRSDASSELLRQWCERALAHPQAKLSALGSPEAEQICAELISARIAEIRQGDRKAEAVSLLRRFLDSPALAKACKLAMENHPEWGASQEETLPERNPGVIASGRIEVLRWLSEAFQSASGAGMALNREVRFMLKSAERLPSSSAWIRYFVMDGRAYALVASGEEVSAVSLGKAKRVEDAAQRLEQELVLDQTRINEGEMLGDPSPSSPDNLRPILTELYGILIEPILPTLSQKRALTLEMPAEMHALPVHALLSERSGRFLLEDFTISYQDPSMTSFDEDALDSGKLGPVVVLAGELPSARQEAEAIRASYPSATVFSGASLGPSLSSYARKACCLHISAHYSPAGGGSLDFGAAGSKVTVPLEEIYRLEAPDLRLVTLSCCESARASLGGTLSLVDAFGLAGAQAVLGTLWQVSDRASVTLAREFYAKLASGMSKASALQQAQCTMKSQPGLKHPFYWAAYALFGDPR